jgi:hypothetical protein
LFENTSWYIQEAAYCRAPFDRQDEMGLETRRGIVSSRLAWLLVPEFVEELLPAAASRSDGWKEGGWIVGHCPAKLHLAVAFKVGAESLPDQAIIKHCKNVHIEPNKGTKPEALVAPFPL